MLERLKVTNTLPAKDIDLVFGSRLNGLIGNNGLGKSFFLDLIWFALTQTWPAEVNPRLMGGLSLRPADRKVESRLSARIRGSAKYPELNAGYSPEQQTWTVEDGRAVSSGLVFYFMADGSVAIWNPLRPHSIGRRKKIGREEALTSAYVLSPKEVFNGLRGEGDEKLCNGLLDDWARWTDSRCFEYLAQESDEILKILSPSDEPYSLGMPVRAGLSDTRRLPILRLPDGECVPMTHVSSALKRVAQWAYCLVWSVNEQMDIAKLTGKTVDPRVVLLIDEPALYLHQRWQETIVPSFLEALDAVYARRGLKANVQLVFSTESPLVTASVESLFDSTRDKWFELVTNGGRVSLSEKPSEK